MRKRPTICRYMEAVGDSWHRFRTLGEVRPEYDTHGRPSFRAGNYSVVFRICCEDTRRYALKCYMYAPFRAETIYAELAKSRCPYLIEAKYLPDELLVDDEAGTNSRFPVVVMEWIDGESLGSRLGRLCRMNDREGIKRLAECFVRMAVNLLSENFAHGDLKQDNILVDSQKCLRLIDYDGVFLPEFSGQQGKVLGSPLYQHPARDEHFFCKAIDDYPIAVIALSLYALADEPSLFFDYHDGENIVLDARETCRGTSSLLNAMIERWELAGRTNLVALARVMLRSDPAIPELKSLLEPLIDMKADLPGDIEIVDDEDLHCVVFRSGGLFGYADCECRRVLLAPIYLDATPFRGDLAVVRTSAGYRVIDRTGACRVDCREYSYVGPFCDGRAVVCREERYGFIDDNGSLVIPLRYVFASNFREGLAVVRVNDKFGYVDTTGKMVIKAEFDHAGRFRCGRARVERNGEGFYIDRCGKKCK